MWVWRSIRSCARCRIRRCRPPTTRSGAPRIRSSYPRSTRCSSSRSTAERLDWIVGAFFYQENNSIRFDIDVRDDRGAAARRRRRRRRALLAGLHPAAIASSSAWAGFGQLTWHLSDSARAQRGRTLHRRHQAGSRRHQRRLPHAERHHRQRRFQSRRHRDRRHSLRAGSGLAGRRCRAPAASPRTTTLDKDWSKVTYMARFEYDLARRPARVRVDQQRLQVRRHPGRRHATPTREVVNYELGLKATLLDGSMAMNTVGFFSNYSDILRARIEWDALGHPPAGDAQCHARAHLRHRIRVAVEARAERRAAGRFYISQRRVSRLSDRGLRSTTWSPIRSRR